MRTRPASREPAGLRERRWIVVGLNLPGLAILVHGLGSGRVADPLVFALTMGALIGLTLLFTGPLWWASPPPAWRSSVARGQVVVGVVGAALLLPLFTVGLAPPDVGLYAGGVAALLVAIVHAFPPPARVVLVGWTTAVWFAVLWVAEVHDPATLLLHAAGAVVVTAGSIRVADALAASNALAAADRRRAEQRASVLAAVLRTRSLEPDEVFRAVIRTMADVGFDAALLRKVDGFAGVAVLVEQSVTPPLVFAAEVNANLGLLGAAVRERREMVVDDVDGDPRAIDHGYGLRGAIVVPLLDGDEVVATVSGASFAGPLDPDQLAAARALAAAAGEALRRDRAAAADRRTTAELQRLDRRTLEFVTTVSHELRTPLTALHGLGQTLRVRWSDLDATRRVDLLHRIDANVERLTAMVLALIERNSFERGELELVRRVVPLEACIRAVLDRLTPVSACHPVELEVDPGLAIEVDPALFDNVLENLLMNVAVHTASGTRVHVSARRVKERVVVTVADDGPGIPPEDLPHVSERAYRGAPAGRTSSGLGLGLALVRQIVVAHGSDLTVESAPGEGATFRFSVPAAP
jgi:signal transduction histidine kinase